MGIVVIPVSVLKISKKSGTCLSIAKNLTRSVILNEALHRMCTGRSEGSQETLRYAQGDNVEGLLQNDSKRRVQGDTENGFSTVLLFDRI